MMPDKPYQLDIFGDEIMVDNGETRVHNIFGKDTANLCKNCTDCIKVMGHFKETLFHFCAMMRRGNFKVDEIVTMKSFACSKFRDRKGRRMSIIRLDRWAKKPNAGTWDLKVTGG